MDQSRKKEKTLRRTEEQHSTSSIIEAFGWFSMLVFL